MCVDKCDNITEDYLDCYKNPKGYYLDKNETKYKKCFYTCETCEIKGNYLNHNCIACNNNLLLGIRLKNNNYMNCYDCNYYYYFDNNSFFCTNNFSCPGEYPDLIKDKNECVKSCGDTKKNHYEFRNKCLISCPENFVVLKEKPNSCTPECPKEKPFLYLNTLNVHQIAQ